MYPRIHSYKTQLSLIVALSAAAATSVASAQPTELAPAPSPDAPPPAESVASAPPTTAAPLEASPAAPAGPAPSAAPPADTAPLAEAPAVDSDETVALPAWLANVSLGGGLLLYYYQPTQGDGKNNVSVFFANLVLDGNWGPFGLHIEPRFRDTRLRSFFEGPAWLQEAYASAELGPVVLKVGKSYKRLGLFWDNSFYGNVQVYDGLKLDPNYGLSLEGSLGERVGVDFSAQYFIVDGSTNVSLPGRDTLSIPGARRRNALVGRAAPFLRFGEASGVQAGVSAEHFTADLPIGDEDVTRFAAEAKLSLGSGSLWGEYLLQKGRHVTEFPVAAGADGTPGLSSEDNRYLLVGGEYGLGPLTVRYNVSFGDYDDVGVSEVLHVPALGFKVNDHLSVLGEYVSWQRESEAPDGTTLETTIDESVNVTVYGHF